MNSLHHEVFLLLTKKATSYAQPMNSQEIGEILKVTPSYVRSQLSQLVKDNLVGVRRGNGGGYYVIREGQIWYADGK
ncbi:MAG: Rrf2 family transcriptional regulator [Negativicutes bacterium]|nr:Rrf2 family transcriptional regulator [Negativicutes bacterium]